MGLGRFSIYINLCYFKNKIQLWTLLVQVYKKSMEADDQSYPSVIR